MNKKQLSAQQVLDAIRKNKPDHRECNIKTLNTINTIDTIDTKNYKTKNYEISSVFAPGVCDAKDGIKHSQSIPQLPMAVASLQEERSSQEDSGAVEFSYMSASVKAPRTERRTLNLDFRLSTSPAGHFNKLSFFMAHSDRSREFFSNIPKEHHQEWEYQEAYEYFVLSNHKQKWIGKGKPRGKYIKGKYINSKIEIGNAAVLELTPQGYVANLWLDGHHKVINLSQVDNQQFPYRYDSGSIMQKTEVLPRRSSWL